MKKAIAVLGLPANPLDTLIDQLGGPQHVAEMTGRKARLVRQQGAGLTGVKWEARNASGVSASATLDLINVHERQMFLNLEKRIAIISEAASAGISLHADRWVGAAIMLFFLVFDFCTAQENTCSKKVKGPYVCEYYLQPYGQFHKVCGCKLCGNMMGTHWVGCIGSERVDGGVVGGWGAFPGVWRV